jgi:hypothetical protein
MRKTHLDEDVPLEEEVSFHNLGIKNIIKQC